MQRFIAKRVLSGRDQFPRWQRWFSHAVQKEATSLNDNGVDVVVPKIPPFDYSPPPYDGPSADEILAKRKEYLSPSMFYFYKKPVSFCVFASLSIIGSTDFVLIHFISFWFFFLPVFIFFDVSFWLFVCRFLFFWRCDWIESCVCSWTWWMGRCNTCSTRMGGDIWMRLEGLLRCAAGTATLMWSRPSSTKPTAYNTPPSSISTKLSLISPRPSPPSCLEILRFLSFYFFHVVRSSSNC